MKGQPNQKVMPALLVLIIGLAGISFTATQAQVITRTIYGQVADIQGKTALPGANVILVGSNPLIGATTDLQGRFILEGVPVGRHSFKATFLGFKPVIKAEILISSGKETFLSFEMEEDVIETKEVEIKATIDKDKPINRMAMVSARSFSVEESRRYAGSADDPMRAVSAFAGVATGGDVASNEIVIRGNSPKGLLWRLEGIDIPNPNHFAFAGNSGGGITMLSSQVLGNSDFYTAAFPSQYGNALSGVFDMRFKNGNNRKHEFAIQAGIQGLDLAAEGPLNRKSGASYLVNYRYSILAFVQLVDPEMKNKVPQYQDISFKINLPAGKAGTFSLVGIGGISRSTGKGICDTTQWKTLDDRTDSELNNNMGAIGLIHHIRLTKKTMLRSSVAATFSEVQSYYSLLNSQYEAVPNAKSHHQLGRLSGSAEATTKITPRHINKTGISYTNLYFNIDSRARNPFTGIYGPVDYGKGSTDLVQAFSESKIDLSPALSLAAGLHFQYLLLNQRNSLEPRIGLRWQMSNRQAFSAGYGMHAQMEDVGLYLAEQRLSSEFVSQPNRKLDFSRARHFVLGYDFLIRNDLRFKTEAYYQYLYSVPVMPGRYFSLINSDGGYTSDSLVNNGTGRNIGLDLTFEKFLTRQFYYLITVSLFDSRYKGGDGIERNTRYNAGYVVNLLGGKEWTIRKNNLLGVNLKASYTGGSYYVPIDLEKSMESHYRVLDESRAFEVRNPDFLYIDLTLTYRTNHRKFSGIWAIQLKNLLNRKTEIGQVYNDFNQTIEPVRSMGILPFISYKIEF